MITHNVYSDSQTDIYGNIEKYIQIGCVYGNVYFQKDKLFPSILTDDYPKPVIDNIVNREQELIEFHKIFRKQKIIAISGFGGIGKTTFAGMYREKYINEYEHLLWINCISIENGGSNNQIYPIAKYFYNKKLFDNLGIVFEPVTNRDDSFYNEILGIIVNRLNEIKKSGLLIIDNADNKVDQNAIYNKLNTLNNNWKILIISRENISGHFRVYDLNFLSVEKSIELFYLYYKRNHNDEIVDEIVKIVGFHTLTIELLAKTVQANRALNLQKLKELLKTEGLNISRAVLVKTTFDKVEMDTYIFECLKSTFYMIKGLEGSKKKYLLQFSVLPSLYLSYEELIDYFRIGNDIEDRFNEDLNFLRDKGLVQETNNGDFKCHQVLQEVIRNEFTPKAEDCRELIYSFIKKLEYDPIANAIAKEKYLPFAESILRNIQDNNLMIASLAHNMNDVYDSIGEYEKSVECELKAIKIREELDYGSLDLAQSYNNIGVSYARQCNWKDSLKFHRKALRIRRKILDRNDPNIAYSLSNIAVVYYSRYNIIIALNLYIIALNILHKKQDEINENAELLAYLARIYNDLGMCFYDLKNYDSATELLERSISIQREIYEKNHHEIVSSIKNLGLIFFEQERYHDSYSMYESALESERKIYKSNNIFMKDTENSLEIIRDRINQR